MSVTARTMTDLTSRVPRAAGAPQLELPIGWEPADWARVRRDARPNPLFASDDGRIHVCAVGTLLPTAFDGLRALLEGVSLLCRQPGVRARLRIWFVGTSNERRAGAPALVRPLAAAAGLADVIVEHPPRLAYFDAMRVLRDAHAVLILGSREAHYTPSRAFPALASGRPTIARLHPASPAWALLSAAAASRPVDLVRCGSAGDEARGFAAAMSRLLASAPAPPASDIGPLAAYSGEALARQTARFLDEVCRR